MGIPLIKVGTGTTGRACKILGRRFIGIELNPAYLDIARRRIEEDAPLFNRTKEDEYGF